MTTLTLFIEVLLNIYQLALINFSFNYCHHRTFTTTIITNISITCPTINTPTLRIMIHQNTTTAPQPPTTMPPPHYHTTTITYSITTKSPALTSSTVTSIFSSIVTASINTFCNTWVCNYLSNQWHHPLLNTLWLYLGKIVLWSGATNSFSCNYSLSIL